MEKENQKYEQFKNIGIDVDFIEENAQEHNDKISKFYHGGAKPTEQVEPQSTGVQQTSTIQKSEIGEEKVNDISKEEIQQMIQEQVHALASKMQQYADETDARLKALEEKLSSTSQHTPSEPVQKQETLQKPQESAKPAEESKSGFSEEDVSIEKMFNFSGNNTGKR